MMHGAATGGTTRRNDTKKCKKMRGEDHQGDEEEAGRRSQKVRKKLTKVLGVGLGDHDLQALVHKEARRKCIII